jgi:hypothetical protein
MDNQRQQQGSAVNTYGIPTASKKVRKFSPLTYVLAFLIALVIAFSAYHIIKSYEKVTTYYNPFGNLPVASVNGGGPGQSYMSQAEAAELVGPGGTYNAIEVTNRTNCGSSSCSIQSWLENNYNGNYAAGVMNDNITTLWTVAYIVNSTGSSLEEEVLQAPNGNVAKHIYSTFVSDSGTVVPGLTVANSTIGDTEYAYGAGVYNSTKFINSLISYRGDEVTVVMTLTGTGISSTALATTVAGDMPGAG